MTDIDFDSINRELEESAAKRNTEASDSMPFDVVFQKMQKKIIQDYIDKATENKKIDYYFDLDSKGLKLFMRRLIRRINKFLFFKNFQRQADFNSYILQLDQMLYKYSKTLEEKHENDMQKIRSLEERIRVLEEKQ